MATQKKKKTLKKRKTTAKKKAAKRKPAAKKKILRRAKRTVRIKKAAATAKPKEEGLVIGIVTHYFPHVQAAVTKLKAPLNIGDTVKIKGHTTNFTQEITSMQINRVAINSAKKGDEIGLQVTSRVRQHDVIYKI